MSKELTVAGPDPAVENGYFDHPVYGSPEYLKDAGYGSATAGDTFAKTLEDARATFGDLSGEQYDALKAGYREGAIDFASYVIDMAKNPWDTPPDAPF